MPQETIRNKYGNVHGVRMIVIAQPRFRATYMMAGLALRISRFLTVRLRREGSQNRDAARREEATDVLVETCADR